MPGLLIVAGVGMLLLIVGAHLATHDLDTGGLFSTEPPTFLEHLGFVAAVVGAVLVIGCMLLSHSSLGGLQ